MARGVQLRANLADDDLPVLVYDPGGVALDTGEST